MSLTNKVAQFDADSDLVNAWVHGPASGIGSSVSTDAGLVRTPAKLIADKSVDVDAATSAAIAGNIATVSIVASSIANVNAVGNRATALQIVADNLVSLSTVSANIINVQNVGGSIDAVDSAYENIASIQSAASNAAISADAAAYITNFVDAITLRDMAFPLDLGLVVDPVPPTNTFDLGTI